MVRLSFHGGIDEIGGNKILLEDKDTRVFLDFGMQMGKRNEYYSEFLVERKCSGMGDLFQFGLLPRIGGIYRKDYSEHMSKCSVYDKAYYGGMGENDHKAETSVDGVLLSHAHVDHCAYIKYLRPEIPIHCTEASKLIMQAFDDKGGGDEYITYKESFKQYETNKGTMGRAKNAKNREEIPREFSLMHDGKKFSIGSIEIEPLALDHSLPGVCGFIIHTSSGTIGYTADIRFHGRRTQESQRFLDRCASEGIDYMLCEGTRINTNDDRTELKIEGTAAQLMEDTKGLVVCGYPARDLDRMYSFYLAAKKSGRKLAIDAYQAYLLKLFDESEHCQGMYPKPDDPALCVFMSRKSWGLIGYDREEWGDNMVLEDYKGWEREFVGWESQIDYRDIREKHKDYVFYCTDYRLQDLIDVRPDENSAYIRSLTEPFNDEMTFDHRRVKNWLANVGLLKKDADWNLAHVSGHGDKAQIEKVIAESSPDMLIPIHTEHAADFESLHKNVRQVRPGDCMDV